MQLTKSASSARARGRLALLAAVALAALACASPGGRAATWSIQTTATSGGTGESLYDVSCASERRCVAVGEFLEERRVREEGIEITVRSEGLAETWNGREWTLASTPRPPFAISARLRGISCASESSCVAVGSYVDALFVETRAVALQWNGSEWRLLEPVTPAEATLSVILLDVSCSATTACTATGVYHDSRSGSAHLLIERWNGSAWSLQTPPAAFGGLKAVSCPSATSCVAVSETAMKAAVWNGREWSEQTLPDPNREGNHLLGLACASASSCVAVGEWETGSGANVFTEIWDGSRWTVSTPVTPTGSRSTRFESAACTSSTACIVVGAYTEMLGAQVTLAESWNGSRWTQQTTPNREGATSSLLRAVSCTSATLCSAAGANTIRGVTEALVERFS